MLALIACLSTGTIVNIAGLGKVEGLTTGALGVEVDEYLGIPYSEPPVRWEGPSQVKAWEGVRDATKYANTCMGSECVDVPKSEDCLYANIFTPKGKSNDGPLPVMLWIHGGAFSTGCANSYAAAQMTAASVRNHAPVIVVTINYRLNVFGFLGSTSLKSPTDGSIGNFGIQDQRQAMKWIQSYISSFNGDPSRVAIWGESAGAGSVTNHLTMKKSIGLYSSAILESGLGSVWSAKPLSQAETVYQHILNATSCPDPSCLRSLSSKDLEKASNTLPDVTNSIFITWSPVVDGVELTTHPWKVFEAGGYARNITVLAGSNRDEYAYFFLSEHTPLPNATEQDFRSILAPYLPHDPSGKWMNQLMELYQESRYEYPSDRGGMDFWWWAALRAKSDHEFTCPTRRTLAAMSKSDVSYGYFFVHPTETPTYMPGSGKGAFTVPHASDLPFVFNCSKYAPSHCGFASAPETELASTVSTLFATFGATGHAPPPFLPFNATIGNLVVLDIAPAFGGQGLLPITHLRTPQCDFWDSVLVANNP